MGRRKKSQKKVTKKEVAKLAIVFNCPKCSYPKCCKCIMLIAPECSHTQRQEGECGQY